MEILTQNIFIFIFIHIIFAYETNARGCGSMKPLNTGSIVTFCCSYWSVRLTPSTQHVL